MKKIGLIMVLFVMGVAFGVSARQPQTIDMNSGAAMRGEIERQMQDAMRAASAVTGREMMGGMAPATTPEKEMERRRKLINDAHRDFMNIKADARAPVGSSQTPVPRQEGTGADARAPGGSEAVSASSALRELPVPPRAVAIEGRVVIEGGQADAKAPRDQGAGVKYSIEERFVGNLIIATVDPEETDDLESAVGRGKLRPDGRADASDSGRGTAELSGSGSRNAGGMLDRDYQIDTASTGVRVTSLSGGACIRSDGGRDADCVEQEPFTKSKVSEENKYGNFHDGVVSAEATGGKIKIEVSAPEVTFSTSRDKGQAKLNCSHAVFELKPSEFKQMMESGSMTLTKQVGDADRASSSCRAGSTITLNMKIKGK